MKENREQCSDQENSFSKGHLENRDIMQSQEEKGEKSFRITSFPHHDQKHSLMGYTSWQIFRTGSGERQAECLQVAHRGVSGDRAEGDKLGRTLAALQDLFLMLMTLDHSVSQT